MKLTIRIILVLLLSLPLLADEKDVDPANLTQVNTFVFTQLGNEEATLMGGLSGTITNDLSYLILLEYARTHDRDFDDKNDRGRARVFGVHQVDNNVISAIGVSIDYIKVAKKVDGNGNFLESSTQAYGVIAKVETGLAWLSIYPNVAYVNTTIKGFNGNDFNLDSNGYLLNLFASIYLNEEGRYLMLQPQYTDTKYVKIKKIEVSYGEPISTNKRWWVELRVAYEENKIDSGTLESSSNSKSMINLGLAYYF